MTILPATTSPLTAPTSAAPKPVAPVPAPVPPPAPAPTPALQAPKITAPTAPNINPVPLGSPTLATPPLAMAPPSVQTATATPYGAGGVPGAGLNTATTLLSEQGMGAPQVSAPTAPSSGGVAFGGVLSEGFGLAPGGTMTASGAGLRTPTLYTSGTGMGATSTPLRPPVDEGGAQPTSPVSPAPSGATYVDEWGTPRLNIPSELAKFRPAAVQPRAPLAPTPTPITQPPKLVPPAPAPTPAVAPQAPSQPTVAGAFMPGMDASRQQAPPGMGWNNLQQGGVWGAQLMVTDPSKLEANTFLPDVDPSKLTAPAGFGWNNIQQNGKWGAQLVKLGAAAPTPQTPAAPAPTPAVAPPKVAAPASTPAPAAPAQPPAAGPGEYRDEWGTLRQDIPSERANHPAAGNPLMKPPAGPIGDPAPGTVPLNTSGFPIQTGTGASAPASGGGIATGPGTILNEGAGLAGGAQTRPLPASQGGQTQNGPPQGGDIATLIQALMRRYSQPSQFSNIDPAHDLRGQQINPGASDGTQYAQTLTDRAAQGLSMYNGLQPFMPIGAYGDPYTARANSYYDEASRLGSQGLGMMPRVRPTDLSGAYGQLGRAEGALNGMQGASGQANSARGYADSALSSLNGAPSRAQLAADTFRLAREQGQEGYDRDLSKTASRMAALGRIGNGNDTSIQDLSRAHEKDLGFIQRDLSLNAAGQELQDRESRLNSSLGAMGAFGGEDRANGGLALQRATGYQNLAGQSAQFAGTRRQDQESDRNFGLNYGQANANNSLARAQFSAGLGNTMFGQGQSLRNEQRGERTDYQNQQMADLAARQGVLGSMSGLENSRFGQDQANQNAYRGEREYQAGQSQQAFDNQRTNLTLQDYLTQSQFGRDKSILDTIMGMGYGGTNPANTLLAAGQQGQPDTGGMGDLASLFAFRNGMGGQTQQQAPAAPSQAGIGGAQMPGGVFSPTGYGARNPLRF